jgi:hypothetical protein
MLSEFNNEVLSQGPSAVLPQNLNNKWFQRLQLIANEFLDSNLDLDKCRLTDDTVDPVLVACVYEILIHQLGDGFEIPSKELTKMMAIYSLCITIESVRRETDLVIQLPDLDNILSIERIVSFGQKYPEFIEILRKACILEKPTDGWLQSLKKKIGRNV